MTERLLDAAAVADWLDVPKSWVYEAARSGLLPHVRLGRYTRFRRETLEAWLAENEHTDGRRPRRRVVNGRDEA